MRSMSAEALRLLESERTRSDELRSLSDPAFSCLNDLGLFQLALPEREASPLELITTTRILAHYCPSAAWYVGVNYAHALLVHAYFPEAVIQRSAPIFPRRPRAPRRTQARKRRLPV